VEEAKNKGFPRHEVRKIRRLVEKHEPRLIAEWHDYFDA
jgi:predicted component of type VI protein secretion system